MALGSTPLTLSAEAIRVLGALMEKEKTTPDNYPLTLNGLVSACNQSTNRFPVVAYDELTVERALGELRDASLALRGVYAGSRVPKHRHSIESVWNITPEAQAVLTVLLLRGEQTLGEIKTRTERMCTFSSLDDCEKAVDELCSYAFPLARRISRIPGHKEGRITHCLVDADQQPQDAIVRSFQLIDGDKPDEEVVFDGEDIFGNDDLDDRVERLEKEVTVLTNDIMRLRAEIDALRDPSA